MFIFLLSFQEGEGENHLLFGISALVINYETDDGPARIR
jgi:hypothetical protein